MQGGSNMKKTSFRKKTYEEIIESKKKAQAKQRAKPKVKKKKPKLPTIKTMRNKCDKQLTPIIKKMYPQCLLCPYMTIKGAIVTQVAHHHVHKSKSSALRYEIDNLIPLCNHCHLVLHNNESYWASVIVKIRGLEWFGELEKVKNKIVKTNRQWYEEHYLKLKAKLDEYGE